MLEYTPMKEASNDLSLLETILVSCCSFLLCCFFFYKSASRGAERRTRTRETRAEQRTTAQAGGKDKAARLGPQKAGQLRDSSEIQIKKILWIISHKCPY